MWGDSLLLVEELRLGQVAGSEATTFGDVQTLAPTSDGGVLVADRIGPFIRRFAGDGTFLGNVGGSGGGPGEFLSVDALAVTEDGSVVVIDQRLRRLSVFSPRGTFLSSFQAERLAAGIRAYAVSPDGTVFTRILKPAGAERVHDARGLLDWGSVLDWGMVNPDGTLTRIAPLPLERREGPAYVLDGRGGPYRPMSPLTVSTIGPDGSTYWARNDEYKVFKRSLDGDTTVMVREGQEAIPLSDEELREWTARSRSMLDRNRGDRDRFFPIPTVKPLIREVAVDLDGRLWVSRYTEAVYMEYTPAERAYREAEGLPSYQWRDTLTWDVFDEDGVFLGTVTFPMRTTFMTATGREVWGVQSGEHREDYVVRWRIEAF